MNLSKTELILSKREEMIDWVKSIQILKEKKVEILWEESQEDIELKKNLIHQRS